MTGVLVAATILCLWILTVGFALTQIQLSGPFELILYLCLSLLIQFLYMGLFITVHDACHGSVAPGRPRVNLWIGRLFAFLYAGFSFDKLSKNHHNHHRFSGTDQDPDFHQQERPQIYFWLFRFLKHYVTVPQVILMSVIAQVLMHGLLIPEINVFAFWVIPSLLSGLQLFFFGTYLPHKKPHRRPFQDQHHTHNVAVPVWWSFVSCYHFGAFHHTHHRSPKTPWFKLPTQS